MRYNEIPANAAQSRSSRRRLLAALGAGLGALTLSASRSAADGHDVTITLNNNGSSAWQVTNIDGDGANAPLNQDNPTIEFKPGIRYQIENNGWSFHPLEFRDNENSPLLSQGQYTNGSFEDDPDVNWIDTGEQLAFTLTNELATELDNYICTVHSQMLGSITVDDSNTEPAASVSFITASHGTVGINRVSDNILINKVSLDDGGFVAIHDDRLEDGQPVESVIGVSKYLQAGEHENIFIPLNQSLDSQVDLTAMPHRDTNGNEQFDFIDSDGTEDGPYTVSGDPITDSATAIPVDYESPQGGLTITEPTTNDSTIPEVTPPFNIIVETTDFVVEAASNGVTDGHGHLHALIDRQPVSAGEYFVFGTDNIIHYGTGQKTIELTADEIRPGEHTIRMQAGDANHVAYDLIEEQTVFVSGTINHYTNESNIVNITGLSDAFDDWQGGEIGVELLAEVFEAWQSGDPVT